MVFTQHLEIAGFLAPVEASERSEDIVQCYQSPKKPTTDQAKQESKAEQQETTKQRKNRNKSKESAKRAASKDDGYDSNESIVEEDAERSKSKRHASTDKKSARNKRKN